MRIGEVARRSGVSARMLRHYESLGLVRPSERTSAGYREYSDADIGRVFHIEGLRKLGMTLAEAGAVLDDADFDPRQLITQLIDQTRQKITAEQALLAHLETIGDLGHESGERLLLTIDLMRSLESADVIQRHKAALGSGVDGGVPIEALARAVLHEPTLNAAGAMRWALAQSGAEAVRILSVEMKDPSVKVRRNVVRALEEVYRHHLNERAVAGGQASQANRAEPTDQIERDIAGALRLGLDDSDEAVRVESALALGRMGDAKSIPRLLGFALQGPKDIDAAEVLAGFIRAESSSTAAATIMDALHESSSSTDPEVRFRVLQVLMEIYGAEADAFIGEFNDDEDPRISATATATLRSRQSVTSRAVKNRSAHSRSR